MTARSLAPAAEPEAYSIETFAARFGICKTAVYALIRDEKLSARKYGRRTLIPADAAREWLASLPAYKPPGVRFGHATA